MSSSAGNQYDGPLTIVNNATHEVYLSSTDTSYFSDIVLSNTNTGGIVFGNTGGVSFLTSGKTITIGSGGFTNNYLTLKNFYQQGSTSQTLTLTGTAILNLINANFEGNLTVTTPGILLKNSTFNGTTSITRNGSSGSFHCDGGNTFAGALVLDNAGSSGRVRMANTTPDTYLGNVTFNSTGGQDVQIAYTGNNIFEGNITINSNKVVFNTSNGKVTFVGGNAQSLNGSYNFPFKKLAINKSSNHVTANTTLSVDDTLFFVNGNIVTTSLNLLTLKAGSTAYETSENSFVAGSIKKVGNTAFVFPIGDNEAYLPIEISAPFISTDAFTAQCFNSRHTLGETKDPTLEYVSECFYWNLTRTTGSSKVKGKFYWDYGSCGIVDSANLRLANWNGSNWEDLGVSFFHGNYTIGNILPTDSLSQFGNYALAYTKLPIPSDDPAKYIKGFGLIENAGQLKGTDSLRHSEVKFYTKFDDKVLMLQDTLFSYQFYKYDSGGLNDTLYRMDMRLHGAHANTIKTLRDSSGGYNHFYTDTITNWYDSVYTWYSVTYKDVYDSIDIKFRSDVKGFDFIVRPGAVSSKIKYSFIGADTVYKYHNDLTASCRLGSVYFNVLDAYQIVGGIKTQVSISYNISNGQVTYSLGTYDTTKTLTISAYKLAPVNINPLIPGNVYWATFLGNNGSDAFTNITTNPATNEIYVVGSTSSYQFIATGGVFQQFYAGGLKDAFVVKFTSGRAKQWATYIGGSYIDLGSAIALENNSVYVGGNTFSFSGFPICAPCGVAFSTGNPGSTGQDFIVKLTVNGTLAVGTGGFSTYFGGSSTEGLHAMVGDGSGNVYFGGVTADVNPSFPITTLIGAYNMGLSGNNNDDCYIAKINSSNNLIWCTQFGSGLSQPSLCEEINAMVIDAKKNLFITGTTCGSGYPTIATTPLTSSTDPNYFPLVSPGVGAYVADNANGAVNNSSDAFIAKFNGSNALIWSTEFGGQGTEILLQENHNSKGIALTSTGDPYIFGSTNSAFGFDFENYGTYNQTTYGGGGFDAFIAYFKSYTLVWSTLYGGQGIDYGVGVCVDKNDDVYFSGVTTSNKNSPAFPLVQAASSYFQGKINKNNIAGNKDAFFAKFSNIGNHNWSTYYGGKQNDIVYASAVINTSDIEFLAVGSTNSVNFGTYPLTGAYNDANLNLSQNTTDAFIINMNKVCFGCLREASIVEETEVNSEPEEIVVDKSQELVIYPNPSSAIINISLSQVEERSNVEVIDMIGNVLYEQKNVDFSTNLYEINISKLKMGIYLVRIINEKNVYLHKFMKK